MQWTASFFLVYFIIVCLRFKREAEAAGNWHGKFQPENNMYVYNNNNNNTTRRQQQKTIHPEQQQQKQQQQQQQKGGKRKRKKGKKRTSLSAQWQTYPSGWPSEEEISGGSTTLPLLFCASLNKLSFTKGERNKERKKRRRPRPTTTAQCTVHTPGPTHNKDL